LNILGVTKYFNLNYQPILHYKLVYRLNFTSVLSHLWLQILSAWKVGIWQQSIMS